MRYAILASLSLAFIGGCGNAPASPSADAPAQPNPALEQPKLSVALLGDHIRQSVAEQLTTDDLLEVVALPKDADAAAIADAAFKADFVFLVTDATQGPLPVHREHSMILRQLGITSVGLMFANTKQLAGISDVAELLELEELELREVLNAYDLPGDDVTCFHDTKLPAINDARQLILGISATRTRLKRQTPRSRSSPLSTAVDAVKSKVYLMSEKESEHSKTIANGDSVHVFINGNVRAATVGSESQLNLGSSSSAALHFAGGVACAIDDRFIVIIGGHAVGAGVVTNVGP